MLKPTEIIPADGVYYVDEGGQRVRVQIRRERLDKEAMKQERAALLARLKAIPPEPTEKELLAWAREHWPQMDYSAERAVIEARLEELGKAIGD